MNEVALIINQGAGWAADVIWTDAEGLPIQFPGATACIQFRRTYYSPEVLLELDTENGRIVLDEEEGIIHLGLDAAATTDMTVLNGVYDMQIKLDGAEPEKLFGGTWALVPQVSRCL